MPQARYWINCAAYTKVDEAEKNPAAAELYNTTAPGYIANACKHAGVHVVDFSSDYVYNNNLRRPLLETDPVEPKGVYAQSKRNGESAIQASGASHTILRTSWVYGPGGHNFVNTMLRIGKTKDRLQIVGDQLGAPTFTYDMVDAVKELLQLHAAGHKDAIQGIFNFSNAGEVTWDNYARRIFSEAGIPCIVDSITTAEFGAPAPRPSYSVLDCTKISALLTHPIPYWDDALIRFLHLPQ